MSMDWIGWILGAFAIAYAVWKDHEYRVERGRLHSFLKAFKPNVPAGSREEKAIEDEMARVIPPKKLKPSKAPAQ
jgi:hypothetical protein